MKYSSLTKPPVNWQRINFSEPGHLMRFFKKQTGQTVTEFKEEYKGGQFAAESKNDQAQ